MTAFKHETNDFIDTIGLIKLSEIKDLDVSLDKNLSS